MKQIIKAMAMGVMAMMVVTSCTEEKKGYIIDGEISDVKDGMVYLKKYVDKSFVDVDSAFAKWENENLNNEELKYYLDVNNRVMKKLLDVTG